MSRSLPNLVSIGLSASEFAVVKADRIDAAQVKAWAAEAWSARVESMLEAAAAAVAANSAALVRIILAPDLVHSWTVTVPSGTRSLKELKQIAAVQFEKVFDQPSSDWAMVGDWSHHGASLCHAIPANLAASLREAAASKRWGDVDLASADSRLRDQCADAAVPADQPWVRVSVLFDQATLDWYRRGDVFRVCTLGVEPSNPWGRIAQEIQRVGSLWADGAVPAELHWASAAATVPPSDVGVPAVHRSAPCAAFQAAVLGRASAAAVVGLPA